MKLQSFAFQNESPQEVTQQLTQVLKNPSLLVTFFNQQHNKDIWPLLKQQFPDTPIVGATSCQGYMSDKGIQKRENALGILAIEDTEGQYGIGIGQLNLEGAKAAGAKAASSAIESASDDQEAPELLWVIMPPGQEELVLDGIRSVIGDTIPLLGGSSADNDVSGKWQQLFDGKLHNDAVICIAMYPSVEVGITFSSGYEPSEHHAIATRVEGRIVQELNGTRAAEIYNQWLQGEITEEITAAGNVLMKTTKAPLGRKVYEQDGIEGFLLSHPESITPDGGIHMFSEIAQGETLICMQGSISTLTDRARIVCENACEQITGDVAGALIVYCAGCMLTVDESIETVANGINKTLSAPWIGTFTFGEQGCFLDGQNRHGNLMISALVFGKQ